MKTIDRVKKRFVEEGLESSMTRKPTTRAFSRKIDGDVAARLIALSCSPAPEGHARWTLKLLADKIVELNYVDAVSYETVRRALKKNELKPWKQVGRVIPPKQSSDFVAQMETVLDVYKQPYDPLYPVVCMDESPKQLIGESRVPIQAKPGRAVRYDYEYVRNGTCNIFIATEPLIGKRLVKVTETRKKRDWSRFLSDIAKKYKHTDKKNAGHG